MLRITPTIAVAESELEYHFILASGPGGQNVNRVATAVQLRFDAARSPSLSEDVQWRLKRVAGRRMSAGGVLIIKAQRYRNQDRNRQDATDRLVALLRKAAVRPQRHVPSAPTVESREQRLEDKRLRGRAKRLRGPVELAEE